MNNIVQEYALKVLSCFKNEGIRIKLDDDSNTRMSARIRQCQVQKVPYMFIIGEREVAEEKISIRTRANDQINGLSLKEALEFVRLKVNNKEIL